MTLHPVGSDVARALIGFSQDFAALHNLYIHYHNYSVKSVLELNVAGCSEALIKLFLELYSMQQVEYHYALPA